MNQSGHPDDEEQHEAYVGTKLLTQCVFCSTFVPRLSLKIVKSYFSFAPS
jgi:hypothetical protein